MLKKNFNGNDYAYSGADAVLHLLQASELYAVRKCSKNVQIDVTMKLRKVKRRKEREHGFSKKINN